MFKNRFLLVIGLLSLLLVAMTVSLPLSGVPSSEAANSAIQRGREAYAARWTGAGDQPYGMDSATRSYIARGKALEAAGKLEESDDCPTTSQENIFAGIPDNLDSATRSYIAWGLALQMKDDIRACR